MIPYSFAPTALLLGTLKSSGKLNSLSLPPPEIGPIHFITSPSCSLSYPETNMAITKLGKMVDLKAFLCGFVPKEF